MEKYQALREPLEPMWKVKTKLVPLVIHVGVLEAVNTQTGKVAPADYSCKV